MDKASIAKAAGVEVLKASPPVAVTASQPEGFWTFTPVTALTCAYLVLQMAYLVWRWRRNAIGKEVKAD